MKYRHKVVVGLVTIGLLSWFSVSYIATPRRVARLMSELCRPAAGMSCYDPCCGSGRLPLALQRTVGYSSGDRVRIFAQEINPIPFIAAVVNRRMHDLEMTLKLGSSLRHPAFVCADGGLQRFDLAIANPMWNQPVSEAIHRSDRFGRFFHGWPSRSGDWAWVQHLLAHLADGGRMVVMLDREAASRSDDLAEVNVRKRFVESDVIESVVLCPWEISRPRWFVRSNVIKTPQAVLFVINKVKMRPGEILFVNTRPLVDEYRTGNLTPEAVHNAVMNALDDWTRVPRVAEIVSNTHVAKTGFMLDPEVHCGDNVGETTRSAMR